MNVYIGRIAAVVAAAIVTFLLDKLGLPVSEDQRASVVTWLTEGLTGLGGFLLLILYGVFHKIFNKTLNPADTAKAPEAVANRVGLKQP